ncbi:MAG: hypothetical protein ABW214_04055, partial [Terrimicrobiaceae bacterium]
SEEQNFVAYATKIGRLASTHTFAIGESIGHGFLFVPAGRPKCLTSFALDDLGIGDVLIVDRMEPPWRLKQSLTEMYTSKE